MGDIRIETGYYWAIRKGDGQALVVKYEEKAGAFWLAGDDELLLQIDFFYEYLWNPTRLPEPENRTFREFWR